MLQYLRVSTRWASGQLTAELKTCGHLLGIFASIRNRRWQVPEAQSGWTWKLGSLLPVRNKRQEKDGAIPPHQNPTNSACMHQWEKWCWHCSRITEANSKSNTVTSASHCDLLKNYLRPAIRSELHRLLRSSVFYLYLTDPHTLNVFCRRKKLKFRFLIMYIHTPSKYIFNKI